MKRLLNTIKPLWGQRANENFALILDDFIARQGGVPNLMRRMEQRGMDCLVHSWRECGAHEPISGEQLHQLFGTGELRALAAKMDVPPRDLVRRLSHALPRLINRSSSVEIPRSSPTAYDIDLKGLWTAAYRRAALENLQS